VQALILPDHLKSRLKIPHGTLYAGCGREAIESLKTQLGAEKPARVIAVGDITTCNLIKSGVLPDICIVDHLTCRTAVSGEVVKCIHDPDHGYVEVAVENPAGTITLGLVACIRNAVHAAQSEEKGRTLIFVHGEEDLAVMPAVVLAPLSSIVIYGQPSSGCVLINVTREKKKEIRELLKEMKQTEPTELPEESKYTGDDIRRLLK